MTVSTSPETASVFLLILGSAFVLLPLPVRTSIAVKFALAGIGASFLLLGVGFGMDSTVGGALRLGGLLLMPMSAVAFWFVAHRHRGGRLD
jgi:hypothetical protein